jgi:hypothetical protein
VFLGDGFENKNKTRLGTVGRIFLFLFSKVQF